MKTIGGGILILVSALMFQASRSAGFVWMPRVLFTLAILAFLPGVVLLILGIRDDALTEPETTSITGGHHDPGP